MAEWQWGSDKKAVALTEEDIKAVIGRIVEAVTKDRVSDLMDQYKQFVQASADLAVIRGEMTRKDQEILNLQARIATLNGFIASMANGAQPVQYPIQTTQALPSFQDRYAASAPMPPLFSPMPDMAPVPVPASWTPVQPPAGE